MSTDRCTASFYRDLLRMAGKGAAPTDVLDSIRVNLQAFEETERRYEEQAFSASRHHMEESIRRAEVLYLEVTQHPERATEESISHAILNIRYALGLEIRSHVSPTEVRVIRGGDLPYPAGTTLPDAPRFADEAQRMIEDLEALRDPSERQDRTENVDLTPDFLRSLTEYFSR